MNLSQRVVMDWLAALAVGLLLAGCGGGGGAAGGDAAGLIDSSFEAKGLPLEPGVIIDILELPDGSLLLAGSSGFVAKLKADGTLDTTFAGGGVDTTRRGTAVTQSTVQLAPFPQGAITVIEVHSSPCGGGFCDDFSVVARRINENGVGDDTYGVSGIATVRRASGPVVVSPNGRVTTYETRPTRIGRSFFQVQSLDAAGHADAAFASRAYEAVRSCRGSVLPYDDPEPSGVMATSIGEKTLVAASWPRSGLCLVLLDAQGSLDPAFGIRGQRGVPFDQLPNAPLLAVLVTADGQIVVVLAPRSSGISGAATMVPALLFFTQKGDLASVTSRLDGVPTFMVDAVLQSNGKLVSVGFPADSSPPTAAPQLWRSMPNGSAYDGGFGPFAAGYNSIGSGSLMVLPVMVALDRAGRILVGGSDAATNHPAVMRFR